jgi:hypothetical protein
VLVGDSLQVGKLQWLPTSLRAGRAVGGAQRYQAGHWQCRSRHCDVGRWHWPGPGARGGPGRHTGRGVGRTGLSQAWAGGLRGNGARGTHWHSQTAGARARGMGPGTGRCHCTWMKGTTTSGSTSDGRCGLGCWLLAQGRGMWTGCWGVCCLVANPPPSGPSGERVFRRCGGGWQVVHRLHPFRPRCARCAWSHWSAWSR